MTPATDALLAVTSEQFEEQVLQHPAPVLVDFTAEWCFPCRLMAPVVESVARRFLGSVRVARVDVDTDSELADLFRVDGIPALMLIWQGRLVRTWVGVQSEDSLVAQIEDGLSSVQNHTTGRGGQMTREGARV